MTSSPSAQRIYLSHNACLNSSYDFNVLREALRASGFDLVSRAEDAEEIIFSGCAVRETWVEDAGRQINSLHERSPTSRVTVVGCAAIVAQEKLRRILRASDVSFERLETVIDRYTGLRMSDVDMSLVQSNSTDFEGRQNGLAQMRLRVGPSKAAAAASLQQVDREFGTDLELRYRRSTKGFVFYHSDQPSEFITVTRSCLYQCTFCAIPRGRGSFRSVPADDILRKARSSLSRGIRHLILVGDEIGNYGSDNGGDGICDMITAVLSLDPSLRISLRYIEPKPFARHFTWFERLCDQGRIELLYISLQSGSQRILNMMNRKYDIDKISWQITKLRDQTPTIFYSNWMVGFPTETQEDFQRTQDLVQSLCLHINVAIPFSPRPGTPAAMMADHVSEAVKDSRVRELTALIAAVKAAEYSPLLSFLDHERQTRILKEIEDAEMVQYSDSISSPDEPAPKPVPNTVRLPLYRER